MAPGHARIEQQSQVSPIRWNRAPANEVLHFNVPTGEVAPLDNGQARLAGGRRPPRRHMTRRARGERRCARMGSDGRCAHM